MEGMKIQRATMSGERARVFFFSFGRYFIYCYAMYMIYVFGKIQRSGNLNDNFQFINANIRL